MNPRETLERYQNKGQVKKCFGTQGNGAGQLTLPHGISSTASDDIVVADCGNNRIQIFDVNGQVKGAFGSEGNAEGQFHGVYDVCVTSRGLIVASDPGNNRIQMFDEQGKFVREFGREESGPEWRDGELSEPCGVAASDNGLIYVCDKLNDRVQVFSEDGKFVRKFGFGTLSRPNYLSVTYYGAVVVSDWVGNRVPIFDGAGNGSSVIGIEEFHFNDPQGIATDQHGNIILCDGGSNQVQVFTPDDGELVCRFGSGMHKPQGVCVLSDGGIAVCDRDHHRVLIF